MLCYLCYNWLLCNLMSVPCRAVLCRFISVNALLTDAVDWMTVDNTKPEVIQVVLEEENLSGNL